MRRESLELRVSSRGLGSRTFWASNKLVEVTVRVPRRAALKA